PRKGQCQRTDIPLGTDGECEEPAGCPVRRLLCGVQPDPRKGLVRSGCGSKKPSQVRSATGTPRQRKPVQHVDRKREGTTGTIASRPPASRAATPRLRGLAVMRTEP